MKLMLAFVCTALCLIAADVSGRWTGLLTESTADGPSPGPALLILKQEGTQLSGTAGPGPVSQLPIQNGKVENGTITFQLVRSNGIMMKFFLKQEGNEIKGDVVGKDGDKTRTGTLSVKREQ
jgi:hypothetical protein